MTGIRQVGRRSALMTAAAVCLVGTMAASGAAARLVTGTPGDDDLIGTAQADQIRGLAGNDQIRGLAGNDVLRGGIGNDTLYGDRGQDTIFGDDGADDILGGYGPDRLFGYGDDVIRAGAQNDYVEPRDGTITAYGGSGDDAFWAFSDTGDKTLFGEAGHDFVYADGLAHLAFRGGSGDDVAEVYNETADLRGDGGDDSIQFWGGGVVRGGSGDDELWTAFTSFDGPKSAAVQCGPGVDVVHADVFDVVAADCENVMIGS